MTYNSLVASNVIDPFMTDYIYFLDVSGKPLHNCSTPVSVILGNGNIPKVVRNLPVTDYFICRSKSPEFDNLIRHLSLPYPLAKNSDGADAVVFICCEME